MINIKTIHKNIIFYLIILLSFCCKAEIYTAVSISEINNTILELLSKRDPKKTLLIIPLEEFLIQPVDKEFYINDQRYLAILERIEKKVKLSRRAYLEELILTEYENKLVDNYVVKFIKNIQSLGVPMLAFTSNCSGSFNEIAYLEVWTWAYLLDKGIDLSNSPIGDKQFIFNTYHKKIKGSYPTYYKGLLSANSWDEANSIQSVLGTLLTIKLEMLPDVIYIVHKEENFIKSIEQQFKAFRRDTQVVGFVFSPPEKVYKDLAFKNVETFWTKLVNKLNKVLRKEGGIDEKNPYEQ